MLACWRVDHELSLGQCGFIKIFTHQISFMLNDRQAYDMSSGFVQTLEVLESPGIKMLRFPGLESPGKKHWSWKTLEKSWNSEVVVLEILISGTSIAN